MMNKLFAMSVALLIAGCTSKEDSAKTAVADKLRDPGAAQFRNIRARDNNDFCGEVNGKNGYGAYVGFKKFYAQQSPGDYWEVFLDDDETRLAHEVCARDSTSEKDKTIATIFASLENPYDYQIGRMEKVDHGYCGILASKTPTYKDLRFWGFFRLIYFEWNDDSRSKAKIDEHCDEQGGPRPP